MNKVYILGAGTSVDFYPKGYGWESWQIDSATNHKPLPTANNFLNVAIEYKKLKKEYYSDLWSFISRRHGISFEDLERGAQINIENVYREIDQEEGAHRNETAITEEWRTLYQAKTNLLDIIKELLSLFCRHYGPCSIHQKFANKVINEGDNIISFNWDTLMDEALHNTGRWFYSNGYGINFFRMYEDRREFNEDGQSKCYLLKPHGSINWFRYIDLHWSDKDGFTCEEVTKKESMQAGFFTFSRRLAKDNLGWHAHPVNQRLRLGKNYSPLLKAPCEIKIIPPGLKRKEFPEIWDKIKKILENAEEIIAIGFSFNKNDVHVKEEFKGYKLNERLKINLVNPVLGIELENLKKTYLDVFSADYANKIHGTFKEYCEN